MFAYVKLCIASERSNFLKAKYKTGNRIDSVVQNVLTRSTSDQASYNLYYSQTQLFSAIHRNHLCKSQFEYVIYAASMRFSSSFCILPVERNSNIFSAELLPMLATLFLPLERPITLSTVISKSRPWMAVHTFLF